MKRSLVQVAVAALAMLLATSSTAQDEAATPPPAPAAAPGLPSAPVPYTTIRPPRPRPATKAASRPATPAAAQATEAQPAGPAVAGAVPTLAGQPTNRTGARFSAGQALPAAELEAFVDGVVRDAMAREHIAGVTVSVVQNGQVVLKKGYGFADLDPRRPVDPDRTLFRVGSISKTFTWIALMKEVEAGRIRLDAPVNLYLPEKVRIRDQGYQRDVQVQNLMDHSPGFEDRALGHLFENNPDRVRPLDLYLRQERPRRVAAPGVVSNYSNYGAGLAGQAVSYVTGKPFETLVEDEIFRPLGMGRTTFREPMPAKRGLPAPMPAALAADVSDGYRWSAGGYDRKAFEYVGHIAPAGSASSTAGDMARYMIALLGDGQLNGVAIYGPRAAKAFRQPLRPTPPGINGWAHGFMIYDLPGGYKGYGHGGDTLFFHSNMVTIPALNLGIFISTNTETGTSLAGRFPDRLVRAFYAAPHTFPRPRLTGPGARGRPLQGLLPHLAPGLRRARGLRGRPDRRDRGRRHLRRAADHLHRRRRSHLGPRGPGLRGPLHRHRRRPAARLPDARRPGGELHPQLRRRAHGARGLLAPAPGVGRPGPARRGGGHRHPRRHLPAQPPGVPGKRHPEPRGARPEHPGRPVADRHAHVRPLGVEDRRHLADRLSLAGLADDHRLGLRPGRRRAHRRHRARRARDLARRPARGPGPRSGRCSSL
ncbi:serine hydrolase [Phenylobacterium sp. J367]|uniref:serine hydrolase domain-containing protein n=1 Tax=Phenylobacterium sp. J367 TaxID=2898435 RepID=UPI002151076F|nr:serine hydrolase domain-containing protein [Phenylobacterium sp. J367]MCR5879007.1 beta-lactamase family protein [Phenylobacterium sp. J367]